MSQRIHLPRCGRDQLRTYLGRMPRQPAPLLDLLVLPQHPIHRGHRTQVGALVEQLGIDLQRRQINEPGLFSTSKIWRRSNSVSLFAGSDTGCRETAGAGAVQPRCGGGSRWNAPARSTPPHAGCRLRRRSTPCTRRSTLLALLVGIRSLGERFQESVWSSSPGELLPWALTEPCLTVSRYTALTIQSADNCGSKPNGRTPSGSARSRNATMHAAC